MLVAYDREPDADGLAACEGSLAHSSTPKRSEKDRADEKRSVHFATPFSSQAG
jgi:hypothetical protein